MRFADALAELDSRQPEHMPEPDLERISAPAVMREGESGQECERLLPYLRTVDERVGRVTYFEALTALGYLWFADRPVALGVFEVGMGGTWGATNPVAGG